MWAEVELSSVSREGQALWYEDQDGPRNAKLPFSDSQTSRPQDSFAVFKVIEDPLSFIYVIISINIYHIGDKG